jgi:hypothetical protein
MKTYYKAVSIDHGDGFCHSVVGYGDMNLIYEIGKWTEPKIKGTSIMVFDSLDHAKKCIIKHSWWGCPIFTCEVQNPSRKGIFFYRTVGKLIEAAKMKRARKKYTHFMTKEDVPPTGTVFCSAVKLIEKVSG